MGGVAAADLRGRPARVPALRRLDADRGVHHEVVVVDQILTHLRTRTAAEDRPGARSRPASVARGTRRRAPARRASLPAP